MESLRVSEADSREVEGHLHAVYEGAAGASSEAAPEAVRESKYWAQWRDAGEGRLKGLRNTAPGNHFYWRKSVDPQMAAEYEACKTRKGKREYRQKWFADEFKVLESHRAKITSLVDQDVEEAELLTFGALVVCYGGWEWPQAITGAKHHALTAASMGPPWCERCPWSNLLLFRKISRKTIHSFRTAYDAFVKYNALSSDVLRGVGDEMPSMGSGVERRRGADVSLAAFSPGSAGAASRPPSPGSGP